MSESYIVINENINNSKFHYYGYLDLLKNMMIDKNKETVDNLFNLQFSLFFKEDNINDHQIKLLSRILCRENLDKLLQSTWFLRKKHCSVAVSKADIRAIVALAQIAKKGSDSISIEIDWDNKLSASVNITEPLRLIQAVIKPLFIWWVHHVTPQIFTLYETKRELSSQIKQCENIKSFEKKQLSNINDSFLSLDDIDVKLNLYKDKLILINELLQKDINLLLDNWKNEPIFNVKIDNTLNYIQSVTPHSELIKPLWKILNSIPSNPDNCHKLKTWLLERGLCLKNDEYLWL